MARQIRDMVVVITGASAGIGRALAEALSAAGAKLVLAARRLDRLEELNRQLGGGHLVLRTDVSVRQECEELVRGAVGHFGRIDTLICNAGYGLAASVAHTSAEQMKAIFQTNVFGTVDCVRAAVPVMAHQEPRDGWRAQIVIVSSAAARRGLPYFGAYSATKAAQLALAESLRVELRRSRIAVTVVLPIGTDSEFFAATEALSNVKLPPRGMMDVQQSPQTVARAIVRGIRRPRPELWPMHAIRWLSNMGVMVPRLTDWAMRNHRRALADADGHP